MTAPTAPAGDLIAVCGLRFEARLLAAHGIRAIFGQDPGVLETALDEALRSHCTGLVSFGTAGGLAPDAPAGTWVVAESVVTETDCFACDPLWSGHVARVLDGARVGLLAAVAAPVTEQATKASLFAATGAIAVDMESGRAARLAQRHKVPFIACRVVVDPAWRSLPRAAVIGLRNDGAIDLAAIVGELVRRPGQIAGLLRLAADAQCARRALQRGLGRLGPQFAQSGRAAT